MSRYTAPARLDREEDVRHEYPDRQKPHDTRTEFERDRSRILHAEAFRRLQEKQQVFYGARGASYRTRLTHSMEVALIAKALARKFGADPDLCETVALGHDLGHPPFGHNGEGVLNDCMVDAGGYEGNAQSLRIVRRLELKGHRYDGLNLTWASIDGMLKYKTPWHVAATQPHARLRRQRDLVHNVSDDARDLRETGHAPKCVYDEDWDFVQRVYRDRGTGTGNSFECRILDLADDIAYCVSDLQDGLMMGFLSMDDLRDAAEQDGYFDEIVAFLERGGDHWDHARVAAMLGEFVSLFDRIDARALQRGRTRGRRDALSVATSKELASKLHRELVHAVELGDDGLPSLDDEKACKISVLKAVTRTQILRDVRLTTLDAAARKVVRRLFEAYANDPGLLPRSIADRLRSPDHTDREKLRLVCDHVAAMSDDAAVAAYRRLFEPGSQGLFDFV